MKSIEHYSNMIKILCYALWTYFPGYQTTFKTPVMELMGSGLYQARLINLT